MVLSSLEGVTPLHFQYHGPKQYDACMILFWAAEVISGVQAAYFSIPQIIEQSIVGHVIDRCGVQFYSVPQIYLEKAVGLVLGLGFTCSTTGPDC